VCWSLVARAESLPESAPPVVPAPPDTAPLVPPSIVNEVGPAALVPVPPPPGEDAPELKVVVTGTRTPRRVGDDPIGTERIGARELQARNVRDVSRALEGEPGIQVERSFRGSSFQLRGLDAKYVRILVDGMPAVGQVNDVIDLHRFAVEGVDRIEVVRGASSALYGSDALAGVINLISRRPKRALESTVFLQYAPPSDLPLVGNVMANAAGGSIGTRQGDFTGLLSLNWFANDPYTLYAGNPAALPTSGDSRASLQGTGRFSYAPSKAFETSGFVRAGGFQSLGVDLQPPRALFNREVQERELAFGSTTQWVPDELTRVQLLLQGNGFWREFRRQQRQGPGLDEQVSRETLGRGEVQLDRKLQPGLEFTGGAGGQYGHFSSLRIAGGAAQVFQGWTFAQADWTPFPELELIGGLRGDFDSNFGAWASPRIAARLKADGLLGGLAFRASYGHGFRAPSFGERFLDFNNSVANYRVAGNPDLKPETSQGGQLGAEWTPSWMTDGPIPTVRLTGHYMRLTNLIQAIETEESTIAFQQFRYDNYSRAYTGGVEASVRVLWDELLIADVGYAWLDARGQYSFADPETPLPGRAARQLTANLVLQLPQGTEFSSRNSLLFMRTALADGVVLPNIALCDIRLAHRLWKSEKGRSELSLFVQADNLIDVREPEFLSLPGRTFTAGINARY